MHIKEEHYDKIVKLLVEVLVELGVPMSIIGRLVKLLLLLNMIYVI